MLDGKGVSEKPRLRELSQCPADCFPNVLVISGLPWYISEHAVRQYLMKLLPDAEPTTTRLYVDPLNGSSRGHCLVEYLRHPTAAESHSGAAPRSTVDLNMVQQRILCAPLEKLMLYTTLYFLTSTRWDRAGLLPDLPSDPPPLRRALASQVGYGPQGYAVRCGPHLGLPNTVTGSAIVKRAVLRKRLRALSPSSSSSSDSDNI